MQSTTIWEEIREDGVLRAALIHDSARPQDTDIGTLQSWEGVGKAVIDVFSARSMLGAAGCDSAGQLSNASQAFASLALQRIAESIAASKLPEFGASMPQSERRSTRLLASLAHRLIGACSLSYGYTYAKNRLLVPLSQVAQLVVPSGKDPKTLLQEFYQAKRLQIPRYEIIQVEGPAHDQVFTASITAPDGRTAQASSRSKREAEKAAAATFIGANLPRLSEGDVVRPLVGGASIERAAQRIRHLPNRDALQEVVAKLVLPSWGIDVLCLSCVHASYRGDNASPIFGKDNRILAFFGSQVLQWAMQDQISRLWTAVEIVRAGGLAQLTAAALDPAKLIAAFSSLLPNSVYLVGPGERTLHANVRKEVVQAFVGALFLARESELKGGDSLLDGLGEASGERYLKKTLGESLPALEAIAPTKSLLQERCQAIGVRVAYLTTHTSRPTAVPVVEVKVGLYPASGQPGLVVSRPPVAYKAHLSPAISTLEVAQAELMIRAFDIAAGVEGYDTPLSPKESTYRIARWFLHQMLREIGVPLPSDKKRAKPRISRLQLFGISALRQRDFVTFLQWLTLATEMLGEQILYANQDHLFQYYRRMADGQLQQSTDRLRGLLGQLQEICITDPLSAVEELKSSSRFQELVQEAAVYRLLGRPQVATTLGEIVEQAQMLLGKRASLQITSQAKVVPVLEFKGAHLALFDLVVEALGSDTLRNLIIDIVDGFFELSMPLQEMSAREVLTRLQGRALWKVLGNLLPIDSSHEHDKCVRIRVRSVVPSQDAQFVLKAWWAVQSLDRLDVAVNDVIASSLHDVKNELLAFDAAARSARNSASPRDRYQHAANASKHADEARARMTGLETYVSPGATSNMAPFSWAQFIRTLIADMWGWVPPSIAFVPPSNVSDLEMSSNQDAIRSIVTNLTRNAVEAMKGKGRLEMEYVVDDVAREIELEIRDSGPGLTDEQLASLAMGVPLDSSKRNAPGIGLLTTLLLARRIGATVRFGRAAKGGTQVDLTIPSIDPPAADTEEAGVSDRHETEEQIVVE